MRIFLATLALVFGLATANAQIAGQNDPQFKAALTQWLDGEDLAALTALSELAKADNRAAQVFLGRVNEATHTHSHVTGPMERKARIALMRQIGGLSGKSWLKAASEDVPLAVAFLQSKVIKEKPAAIKALLDMGEVTAALMPLASLIQSGKLAEANILLAHAKLPKHVMYLQALANRDAAFIAKHGPVLGSGGWPRSLNLVPNNVEAENSLFLWEGFRWDSTEVGHTRRLMPDAFPESLLDSPYYAPLKALCRARCGNDVPNCMRGLSVHQSFYGTPLWITLASPVETLLSTSDYNTSTRLEDDLIRLMRSTSREPRLMKKYDQCAYQAVFAD